MEKKIYFIVIMIFLTGLDLQAQEAAAVIVNEGELVISGGDLVSFESTFENQNEANLTNDGTVIYFGDFVNEGYYGFTLNKETSSTLFITEYPTVGIKQISGNEVASLYDVTFESSVPKVAFDLKNNIDVYGTVDFQQGIVKVDSIINPLTEVSHGMLTLQEGSKVLNVSDYSHVQGQIEKIGSDFFTFPSGDKGKYRYASISAPKSSKDVFVGQYVYNDHAFFEARPNTVGVVKLLNNQEYWIIEKGSNNQSDILLTLSWDYETTLPELLKDPEEELHIVRWDATQGLWVDEGGVTDVTAQEVTTIATVKGYGVFTLAAVKKDWILDGDVVVYNLVSPNGDGKNDYLIIDNIQNYPNNKIEIFNRWGSRVYETTQYDPNGDGSSNVFTGYSEGKVTVDKGAKLPSGTYYYVLTYEYKDKNGSRMIRKAANLHLETN